MRLPAAFSILIVMLFAFLGFGCAADDTGANRSAVGDNRALISFVFPIGPQRGDTVAPHQDIDLQTIQGELATEQLRLEALLAAAASADPAEAAALNAQIAEAEASIAKMKLQLAGGGAAVYDVHVSIGDISVAGDSQSESAGNDTKTQTPTTDVSPEIPINITPGSGGLSVPGLGGASP